MSWKGARGPAGFVRSPERLAALCELLRDEPAEWWVTLRGGSMQPAIPPGSRVRLRCDRRLPQPGEVAAYRRGSELVIHRVLGLYGPVVRFQGDANSRPDPDVPADQVLGRVVAIRPPTAASRLWASALSRVRRAVWRLRL